MFCYLITGTRLDYEGLCKALEQISEVEKRATSRVIHSQVLKGLDLADIKRAGEHLAFQDGCKRFFQDLAESKNCAADTHVLSYCWCGDLIQSAFSSGIFCYYALIFAISKFQQKRKYHTLSCFLCLGRLVVNNFSITLRAQILA